MPPTQSLPTFFDRQCAPSLACGIHWSSWPGTSCKVCAGNNQRTAPKSGVTTRRLAQYTAERGVAASTSTEDIEPPATVVHEIYGNADNIDARFHSVCGTTFRSRSLTLGSQGSAEGDMVRRYRHASPATETEDSVSIDVRIASGRDNLDSPTLDCSKTAIPSSSRSGSTSSIGFQREEEHAADGEDSATVLADESPVQHSANTMIVLGKLEGRIAPGSRGVGEYSSLLGVNQKIVNYVNSTSTPDHQLHSFPRARLLPRTSRDILRGVQNIACHSTMTKLAMCLPAVILGLTLNLLDALSYGLIIFPTSLPIFSSCAADGLSLFFVSTIVSQLVYSCGCSAFKGGNGSMMIEVVPFFHVMAQRIVNETREPESKAHSIIATTMMSYALSSIVTGSTFLLLGTLKLGSLIGYFPRHILVGCIGGVGWFLLQTAVEVTAGLPGHFTPEFLAKAMEIRHALLWGSSLCVSVILRLLQRKITHPLFVPCFFLVVPVLFYAVVLLAGYDMQALRDQGWLFPLPSSSIPFWHYYTYFDFTAVNWTALIKTLPAMLALTFFGVLHVPINVPALGASCNVDIVDTNRELVAHGISNVVSGLCGSVQNYLVYSNSLLFIRSGGDSRVAGVMLAMATSVVYFMGPSVIGYIPVVVVGSLVFHLGLELLKEAVVDTWAVVQKSEYATIWLVIIAMGLFGFIEGIFLGIILSCFFFVYNSSRTSIIRASITGETAKSTVRRPFHKQQFLDATGRQVIILKLQGYMFFGTFDQLEDMIREKLDERNWEEHPIRFFVMDVSAVTGLDYSAVEAFMRIKRLLVSRRVYLIVAGLSSESDISMALDKAGLWTGNGKCFVQRFGNLDSALEWCENRLLETYYTKRLGSTQRRERRIAQEQQPETATMSEVGSYPSGSLRDRHLHEAGRRLLDDADTHQCNHFDQPAAVLMQTFGNFCPSGALEAMLSRIAHRFRRIEIAHGTIIYRQGHEADALYLVESGSIRITTEFAHVRFHPRGRARSVSLRIPGRFKRNEVDSSSTSGQDDEDETVRRRVETVLSGALLGELRFLAASKRGGTAVADTDSVLWRLTRLDHDQLCREDPQMMLKFYSLIMKYTQHRVDVITTHAFTLQ